MGSPAPAAGIAGYSSPPASVAASAISCLLFTSFFISGRVEGFSLATAKDSSRFGTTRTTVPSRLEPYQPDFRGIKAAMQATNSEKQHALNKHRHQHLLLDIDHHPSSDFERQLEQLKETHVSTSVHQPPSQQAAPVPSEEEPRVVPISRKEELFTPERGAAAPGEVNPLQPDMLESEADVLEELKKLSSVHDAVTDPLLQQRPEPGAAPPIEGAMTKQAPMRMEKARIVGMGGATGDHFLVAGNRGEEDDEGGEDDMEDEIEEEDDEDKRGEEVTTQDPEKEIISLEERLSASLRELAEIRRKQSHKPANGGATNPAPFSEGTTLGHSQSDHNHASSGSGVPISTPGAGVAPSPRLDSPLLGSGGREYVPESKRGNGAASRGLGQRAAMRKAHMAKKLMDPEDPKKDEDLLELLLRIVEHPDEWKRVHRLLRQLDDDLTTYEKTMHRVQALTTQKSSTSTGAPLSEKDARREEMSRSGLPSGFHGESTLSTTTQQPLSISQGLSSHHKDWPKFSYHRVTSAPHSDPFLLLQQEQQHQESEKGPSHATYPSSITSMDRHKNAYIAVSVITPPSARGGNRQSSPGAGRPLPSPPTVQAGPPTRARHVATTWKTTTEPPGGKEARSSSDVRLVAEETLDEPMIGEEEVVDRVVGQESSMHRHMHHNDQVEEQLSALVAAEEKLRHQLNEKERMRHLLKEVNEDTKHH